MKKTVKKYFHFYQHTYQFGNGLKAILVPLKDYQTVSAGIILPYGGNMSRYKINGKRVKSGVAHFLEHRMFDTKKGDGMSRFADLGIQSNAYTSSNETVYHFSANKSVFNEGLDILLEMISDFDFSPEKVEKETKIIIEELRDSQASNSRQEWKILQEAIFAKSYVTIPIVGTLKDLKKMQYQDLKEAYQAFYRPENLTIVIAGAFDLESVVKKLQAFELIQPRMNLKKYHYREPLKMNKSTVKVNLPLAVPVHYLAFKISLKDYLKGGNKKIKLQAFDCFNFFFEHSNKFYLDAVEKKYFDSITNVHMERIEEFGILHVRYKGDKIDGFKEWFIDCLNHFEDYYTEENLDLDYKSLIPMNLFDLINPIGIISILIRQTLEEYNALDSLSKERKFTFADLKKISSLIASSPTSEIDILPKEEAL